MINLSTEILRLFGLMACIILAVQPLPNLFVYQSSVNSTVILE
jgi:hypothetical protein